MLQTIDGLSDDVVGIEAVGEVTAEDYESTLIPAVEAALEDHDRIRLLYVLGDEFEGYTAHAAWEDAKLGLQHVHGWERLACVTDADWIRHGVNAFGWMIPGEVRVFPLADRADAEAWITS